MRSLLLGFWTPKQWQIQEGDDEAQPPPPPQFQITYSNCIAGGFSRKWRGRLDSPPPLLRPVSATASEPIENTLSTAGKPGWTCCTALTRSRTPQCCAWGRWFCPRSRKIPPNSHASKSLITDLDGEARGWVGSEDRFVYTPKVFTGLCLLCSFLCPRTRMHHLISPPPTYFYVSSKHFLTNTVDRDVPTGTFERDGKVPRNSGLSGTHGSHDGYPEARVQSCGDQDVLVPAEVAEFASKSMLCPISFSRTSRRESVWVQKFV